VKYKEGRGLGMTEEGFQFRYFQPAEIGARSARLK
jgi:hypothetical protein